MAQSLFVGREHELAHYQALLCEELPRVLVITGQPGNGKSTLLRRFEEQTPGGTPVARLNFSNDALCADALILLEQLADQLAPHCTKRAARAFSKALQQGRDALTAVKQMSQTIIASDQAVVSGNAFMMSAAAREQRRQVWESARAAFFALLDTLSARRLVLLLDTCERLQKPDSFELDEVGAWLMNHLLPDLHARSRQQRRHFLVVLAGRFDLQLEAFDGSEQQHRTLPLLDWPAVEQYLQRIGIHDTALQKRIYALTHGHALCVSIIGTLWQEHADQPLTLADLPLLQEQFTERALLKFIGERILDRRLTSPFRELVRYGVLLRRWKLPLLQAVFPELHLESGHFDHLRRYPFVERSSNYASTFHDLLREILSEEVREQEPQKWQLYHHRALNYFAQADPQAPESYYHALALEEEQGLEAWQDAVQQAQLQGERTYLSELLRVAHDGALKLSPAACAERAYRQGRFYYYGTEMPAALQSYQQALGLFQQVGDRLGEANVRKAIGDVQQFRDESEAALQSYQQALGLFQQVGDRLGEANCYLAQGHIALAQGDYRQALALHTDAYRLYQQIEDSYSQARVLFYRSFVYEALQEWQSAIQDVETALAIAQRLDLPRIDLLRERLAELQQNGE